MPKFKNLSAKTSAKPLFFNSSIDSYCSNKIKGNGHFIAVPWSSKGILGVSEMHQLIPGRSIKYSIKPPISLIHEKPISDFEFSPLFPSLLASCTKADNIIRIWDIPYGENLESTKEIDIAHVYLGGHEKKIDILKFHPVIPLTVASASIDGTIRLWDIQNMEDKLQLETFLDNEVGCYSLSFDGIGNQLVCSFTNGIVCLYDVRQSKKITEIDNTSKIALKQSNVCYLRNEPYFVQTAFVKEGHRQLALWDTRSTNEPVQTIQSRENGAAAYIPFYDSCFALLYLSCKGEGFSIYEFDAGSLHRVDELKLDKPVTAADLLPRYNYGPNAEVCQFVTFGTDNAIRSTSVFAPKQNADTIFYEELYPDIPHPNINIPFDDWINYRNKDQHYPSFYNYKELREFYSKPIHFDVTASLEESTYAKDLKPTPIPDAYRILSSTNNNTILSNHINSLNMDESCRKENYLLDCAQSPITHDSFDSPTITSETTFEEEMYMEKKGWIRTDWVKVFVTVKRSGIYIFNFQNREKPEDVVPFNQLKFIITEQQRHQIGSGGPCPIISLQTNGSKRYRFTGNFVSTFLSSVQSLRQASQSQKRFRGIIIGQVQYWSVEQSNNYQQGKWIPKIISLDEDGFIQVFENDMKAFVSGKPAHEKIYLSTLTCFHQESLEDDLFGDNKIKSTSGDPTQAHFYQHAGKNGLLIRFPNQVKGFAFTNEQDVVAWMTAIQNVVQKNKLEPAMTNLESPVLQILCSLKDGPAKLTNADQKMLLLSLRNEMSFYSSHLSYQSLFTIPLEDIVWSSLNTKAQDATSNDAILYLKNEKNVRLRLDNESERSRFFFELKHHMMAVHDLHGLLKLPNVSNLSVNDINEKGKTTLSQLEQDNCISVIDSEALNKSTSKALVQICSGTGIQLATGYILFEPGCILKDACYVVDEGDIITHWNEPESSRLCRAKAMEVAAGIRKSRSNRPKVFLIDEDPSKLKLKHLGQLSSKANPTTPRSFTDLSNLCIYQVTNLDTQGQQENSSKGTSVNSRSPNASTHHQNVSTDQNKVNHTKVKMVWEGPRPSKKILDTLCCTIVETTYEVFLWQGKGSTKWTRAYANYLCLSLCEKKAEETKNQIIYVKRDEGLEDIIFKDKFVDFGGYLPISMSVQEQKGNIASAVIQETIDVHSLLAPPLPLKDPMGIPADKITKKMTIYVIKDFKRYPIDAKEYGKFYQDESYIISEIYCLPDAGIEKCVVYFWQGSQSTISDKGTSALMTVEVSDEFKGDTFHVRVVEGKEPRTLLNLFKENTIIIKKPRNLEIVAHRNYFYDIRKFDSNTPSYRIYELSFSDCILNEYHCVILPLKNLTSADGAMIWKGRFADSTLLKKTEAFSMGNGWNKLQVIDENIKKPELLENFQFYISIYQNKIHYTPRLFSVSGSTGVVQINPVEPFNQEDLNTNQVYALDTLEKLYIWFGENSKHKEKIFGIETFRKYMSYSNLHKSVGCQMFVVQAKREPLEFVRVFHGWNHHKDSSEDLALRGVEDHQLVYETLTQKTYSAQLLLSGQLPENVDPTRLEDYLSDDEFEKIFRMKRKDYSSMKPWKKEDIKRKIGFF